MIIKRFRARGHAFRGLLASALLLTALPVRAGEPQVFQVDPGPDFQARAQEALIKAPPGSIVEFPEGRFQLDDELILAKSHITLRGQGMYKTVLNFQGQLAGAHGLLVMADAFTVEDLGIEDTAGDGIKVEAANGATFRRVRVEWNGIPRSTNGGYGIYPVQSRNVLIEDCFVKGASDSGIYVGQSQNIVVRRNTVTYNVAGIEIENSRYADVYENTATENTAGILVFNLPNLQVYGGKQTRVFNNHIYLNNTKNFAPKGNIVGLVPAGTGFMVMANDDVELFGNHIENHETASVGVIDYQVSQIPITDPHYNPVPHRIHIHDNVMHKAKWSFFNGNQLNTIINLLFGFKIPDIVYDGIDDGTYGGHTFPDEQKICIHDNANPQGAQAGFGNMHLDHQRTLVPYPGGPVTHDLSMHDCAHPPIPAVVLDDPLPVPPPLGEPGEGEIAALCGAHGTGINRAALSVNCPRLQDYRLFADPSNPTNNPHDGGLYYDLTTPLFTDYAQKARFVFIPPGSRAIYNPDDVLSFPIGTVIAKTFFYAHDLTDPTKGRDVAETRLLIHRQSGWAALPYAWATDMSEARLVVGGARRNISWLDTKKVTHSIRYLIPNTNKCVGCHGTPDGLQPIGPKARYLNRERQLENWALADKLSGLPGDSTQIPRMPAWDDPTDGTLELRAKAYLEVNCAHCHNPEGRARFSGLFLESFRDVQETAYGTCKPPIAAGAASGQLSFDVVPGRARKSILHFRLNNNGPSIRMPQLGRTVVHAEGVALIDQWINSRAKVKCGK